MFRSLTLMKLGLAFTEEWGVQICNLLTSMQGRKILFFSFQLRAPYWCKSDFMLLLDLYSIHWPGGQIIGKSCCEAQVESWRGMANLYNRDNICVLITVKIKYSSGCTKFLPVRKKWNFLSRCVSVKSPSISVVLRGNSAVVGKRRWILESILNFNSGSATY